MFRRALPILFPAPLLLCLIAGSLIGACSPNQPGTPEALKDVLLSHPIKLEDFKLITQNGTQYTAANLRGHWTLMFFGYTHCPDICPTTLTEMAALAKRMPENSVPQVVFVSVDPLRDTPDHLKQYIAFFNERFLGVTGPMAGINALTEQLGIQHSKEPAMDGEYAVNHSSAVLLIDPQGRYVAKFNAPHYAGSMRAQIELIKEFMAGPPRT